MTNAVTNTVTNKPRPFTSWGTWLLAGLLVFNVAQLVGLLMVGPALVDAVRFDALVVYTKWLKGEIPVDQPMFVDDTVLASAFYRKHAPAGLEAMIAGIPKPQRQALHIPAHASCAVVGNSGNLRQSGYGPRIDAHPVVFRMNQAPTKPFEADVGRRTTVRYTALHHVAALKVEPDVDLIVSGELNRFNMFAAQALPRLGDFRSVHIINKRFTNKVRGFTTHHTSSGIELVFLAIGLCQSVDVYGFGHKAPGLWDHYFSPAVTDLNLQAYPHDSNNEAATLRALDRLSYIRLFGGVR